MWTGPLKSYLIGWIFGFVTCSCHMWNPGLGSFILKYTDIIQVDISAPNFVTESGRILNFLLEFGPNRIRHQIDRD